MSTLSIISVCSEYSEYLNLNKIITTSSLSCDWSWTVAFNSDPRIGERKLDGGFEKRPFISCKGFKIDGVAPNSSEHGENLNALVKYVVEKHKPRFLLALDPDFFIFGDFQEILNKMKGGDLSIFGAPYAESTTPLVRNVPVGFCMLFDREKVKDEDINFSTGYGAYPDENFYPDVGYEMYRKIQDGLLGKYAIVLPYVKSLQTYATSQYGLNDLGISYKNEKNEVGTKIDEYWVQDCNGKNTFWGLHTRGKLNQNRNKNRERIEEQLKTVRFIKEQLDGQNQI